jgi:hypothetical protein
MSPAATICLALALAVAPGRTDTPPAAVTTPAPSLHPECASCHSCAEPTSVEPCLRGCPRRALSASLPADLGPAVVLLDELEDLYVPVSFDHRTHAVMAGMSDGCSICHHYTPPSAPHPACKSCHPAGSARADLVKPGLKGAYHRRCLSCHREWDGEAACEACHEKRRGGRLGGTATTACDHAGSVPIEVKDLILFPTSFAPGDVVPFHHLSHSQAYERDCTECHRQQRCTRCHSRGGDEPHPMRGTKGTSLHDTCFSCHDGGRCDACHGRSAAAMFSHRDTGWPLKPYHASLPCHTCHGRAGAPRALDTHCASCHGAGIDATRFDHAVTGVALDTIHRETGCDACHTGGLGSPARCDGCHDDGRKYAPAQGFAAAAGR